MNRIVLLTSLVMTTSLLVRAQKADKTNTNDAKIARAMSAAPATIAKDARIIDQDEQGTETVLREGTNGFTCFPGHPGSVGDDPHCSNEAALRWERDFLALKPKPTNTEPGIVYMLQGGSDWSAADPNATSGTPLKEPPHWRILWPFDAKTTGLPTEPGQSGAWIMYAGTPWAHLMVNGRP